MGTESGEYDFSKITKIMSHPVAIPQCQNFIRLHSPDADLEGVNSTAEAVEIVKKNPGKGWVAIGTKLAAQKHGLDIMAERVTDHDNNYTRFVLIGHEPVVIPREPDHVKTSLLVTLPEDAPGALHQAHLDRLYDSAKSISLNIPLSMDEMLEVMAETVRRNDMRNGYIRLIVSRGPGNLGLDPLRCPKASVIIIVEQLAIYPEEAYLTGLKAVSVSQRRNIPDALNPKIKSLNYLNNILVLEKRLC
ncbi:hypothetical protein HK101_009317 [Irineochytrium annulatum]|nr:hypothetical protein HK101_009317 [Irineochytrium annulatum]